MILQEQAFERRKGIGGCSLTVLPRLAGSLGFETRCDHAIECSSMFCPSRYLDEKLMVVIHDDRSMQAAKVDRCEVEENGVMRDWWDPVN